MDHMDHSQHSIHDHNDMSTHHNIVRHNMDDMDGMDMDHSSMMEMAFYFSTNSTVLFKQWTFSTVGGLVGSMIGIFFLAALYEGLKYFREYLFWRTYNSLQYRAVSLPSDKTVVTEESQVVQPTMLSKMHFLQTFLHMIQMIMSYFLMLIFMTYNVWLCIAIVLGAGVGYFLFGWKKSVVVDVTEHCH